MIEGFEINMPPHDGNSESPLEVKKEPLGAKGHAVLLNNTAFGYHWGCYGTSMAIYETLIHSGYVVTSFDVDTTHSGLGFPPMIANRQAIIEFGDQLQTVNGTVFRAIADSDLVVVNGEGTLHRFHRAPRSLLATIKLAKLMGKRVHLINHACFPSGQLEEAAPIVEQYYQECLKDVDRIVVRDDWSANTYKRFGIRCEAGFDCLPLHIHKYYRRPDLPASIVVGGASHWSPEVAAQFGRMLRSVINFAETPLIFLSGGSKRPPQEDIVQFNVLRKEIPEIQIRQPTSLQEWIGWIDTAKLVITGRFHHFVAAAAVSAPIIALSGNTAKTNSVSAMLEGPVPFEPSAADAFDRLRDQLERPFRTSSSQVKTLLNRALLNFDF